MVTSTKYSTPRNNALSAGKKLPPETLGERIELYKCAMEAICKERSIPFSSISLYPQSYGYYEDQHEREKGIPVMLTWAALMGVALYFLVKVRDPANQHVGLFTFYTLRCGRMIATHKLSCQSASTKPLARLGQTTSSGARERFNDEMNGAAASGAIL